MMPIKGLWKPKLVSSKRFNQKKILFVAPTKMWRPLDDSIFRLKTNPNRYLFIDIFQVLLTMWHQRCFDGNIQKAVIFGRLVSLHIYCFVDIHHSMGKLCLLLFLWKIKYVHFYAWLRIVFFYCVQKRSLTFNVVAFRSDSDTEIFDSVRTGRFDFPSPEWDDISETAKDFVKYLLQKDQKMR